MCVKNIPKSLFYSNMSMFLTVSSQCDLGLSFHVIPYHGHRVNEDYGAFVLYQHRTEK